jgi:hypothetical protein
MPRCNKCEDEDCEIEGIDDNDEFGDDDEVEGKPSKDDSDEDW